MGAAFSLDLDFNERHALRNALENYLNGEGMLDFDADELVLENLTDRLDRL